MVGIKLTKKTGNKISGTFSWVARSYGGDRLTTELKKLVNFNTSKTEDNKLKPINKKISDTVSELFKKDGYKEATIKLKPDFTGASVKLVKGYK